MPKNSNTDPLRSRSLDLCQELGQRTTTLRDYTLTPGNAWLAKSELEQISRLLGEIADLVEQIGIADSTA